MQTAAPIFSRCTTGCRAACRLPTTRPAGGRHSENSRRSSRPRKLRKLEGALMPPTLANGKICYIEMPALDIQRSAAFYEKVFGWAIRTRGDGKIAFDDTP